MLRQVETPRDKVAIALSDLLVVRELRLQVEGALERDRPLLRRVALKYANRARHLLEAHTPLLRRRKTMTPALAGPHRCSDEAGAR